MLPLRCFQRYNNGRFYLLVDGPDTVVGASPRTSCLIFCWLLKERCAWRITTALISQPVKSDLMSVNLKPYASQESMCQHPYDIVKCRTAGS